MTKILSNATARILLAFCLLLGTMALSPPTVASNDSICNGYANKAMADLRRANSWKCLNYLQKMGSVWERRAPVHKGWCMGVLRSKPGLMGVATITRETTNRRKQIKACIQKNCEEYAKKALAHHAQARAAKCTALERYWRTSRQAHINFCKGTTYQNVQATLKRRDQKLLTCKKNARDKNQPYIQRYLGCYRDFPKRVLPIKKGRVLSALRCAKSCKAGGYKYAGLQYGGECYCGRTFTRKVRVPEARCQRRCRISSQRRCGGRWTNSVYLLK